MLILLAIIFMIIAFITKDDYDDFPCAFCFAVGIIAIVATIGFSIALFNTKYTVQKKIDMYQEENTIIEHKIENAVEKYMQFEKEVMFEVSPDDDVISLISLYPDLKSDELIKSEIDIYTENNKKIKEFKEKQLEAPTYKFLIYFGH